MTPSISSVVGNLFCVLGKEIEVSVCVVTTPVGFSVGQPKVGDGVGTGAKTGDKITPAAIPPATMAPPVMPPTIPPTTAGGTSTGGTSLFMFRFRRPLGLKLLCS